MKKTLLYLCAVTMVCASACSKEDAKPADSVTNQQAALMVTTALVSNANGFMALKTDAVVYARTAVTGGKGCAVPDVFNAARQDAASSTINYNYAMNYLYTINCVGDVKDNLSINTAFNGSFDVAGLSALDAGNCNLTMSDLTNSAATAYTFNGTYNDIGSYHTTDDAKLSGDYYVSFVINNYKANKSNNANLSGTAAVTITGSVKNKSTFSYTGTITFAASQTATLLLDNVKYNVNLNTGDLAVAN